MDKILKIIPDIAVTFEGRLRKRIDALHHSAASIWAAPDVAMKAIEDDLTETDPETVLTRVAHYPEGYGPLVKTGPWYWRTDRLARTHATTYYNRLCTEILHDLRRMHDAWMHMVDNAADHGTTTFLPTDGGLVHISEVTGKQTLGDAGSGSFLPSAAITSVGVGVP